MPKLTDQQIILRFREKFNVLKEKGKVEDFNPSDEQILRNYYSMDEIQEEDLRSGRTKVKHTLRDTIDLFKTGQSSYWQNRAARNIARNLLNTGYDFSSEEIEFLESVKNGRQSANFRKKGRGKLFEIVEKAEDWMNGSSNDENIERHTRYAIFGS